MAEKNEKYQTALKMLGQNRECSEVLLRDIETVVCAMYGYPKYCDINNLRYELFVKRFELKGQVLNSYNGIDMNLLPQCRSSLEMHIKRVNYQVYVWLRAHE